MNTLESYTIEAPLGGSGECACFTIDDITVPFILHDIMQLEQQYTFSLWVKSEAEGNLLVRGNTMPSNTEWNRYTHTFTAVKTDLEILFDTVGTYYVYQPQLERGNIVTDWTEAPEDMEDKTDHIAETANNANDTASDNSTRIDNAESLLQILRDRISMLVTDSDGTTLWDQTSDGGWTFSMAQTQLDIETIQGALKDLDDVIGNVDATVEILQKNVTNIESSLEWVKVTTYEDEPCIALGETDSDFKLLITNTRILFVEGSLVPAYISNQALNIKKAIIEEELRQGDFVWKIRGNGNMGLLWKGVTS